MNKRTERGFTLIEVMIAIVMLTIGVLALVGSSAMVTRMIGTGKASTDIGQRAQDRVDYLRQLAAGTAVPCTAAAFKSDSVTSGGVTEKWIVPTAGNGRTVVLTLKHRTAYKMKTDTVRVHLLCK
jgi:prepilin-type N-terminal cleavage/methylation domain-containing protein